MCVTVSLICAQAVALGTGVSVQHQHISPRLLTSQMSRAPGLSATAGVRGPQWVQAKASPELQAGGRTEDGPILALKCISDSPRLGFEPIFVNGLLCRFG